MSISHRFGCDPCARQGRRAFLLRGDPEGRDNGIVRSCVHVLRGTRFRVRAFVRTVPWARAAIPLVMGVLSILLTQSSSAADSRSEVQPRIRVRIAHQAAVLRFHGVDIAVVDAFTRLPLLPGPVDEVDVEAKGGRLVVNRLPLSAKRIRVETPAVFVQMGRRDYRGAIEVVLASDGLTAVVHTVLEHYLYGAVASEMPATWPAEALKAQAIVSRTYALRRMMESADRLYDVVDDVADQLYEGADDAFQAVRAVRGTTGIVLTKGDALLDARFHSTCGGMTEVPGLVWPKATMDLPAVRCEDCRASPVHDWRTSFSGDELASLLAPEGFGDPRVEAVDVAERSASGRAVMVAVRGKDARLLLRGNDFRRRLGYARLKSTRFTINHRDGLFEFRGQGYGHGVGLCQWGARGKARRGMNVSAILRAYFPGARFGRLASQGGRWRIIPYSFVQTSLTDGW